jgi:hypothetical protein
MKKKTSHTVTLTEENFTALSFFVKLTGLSADELVNFLLADSFQNFNPELDRVWGPYVEETLGCLKYKDRESAKRTLDWCTERLRGKDGLLPKKFRSSIRKLPGGRLEINAWHEDWSGKTERLF